MGVFRTAVAAGLVGLVSGAEFPADLNFIRCSEYTCPTGQTYKQDYDEEELTYELDSCATEDNVFSKYVGSMKIDGDISSRILDVCTAKGYDTVGRIWRAMPNDKYTNTLTKDNTDDETKAHICNNKFEHTRAYSITMAGQWWAMTFECINEIETASKCCTEWDGSCYGQRTADNNFHGCSSCGPPPGPCVTACGNPFWKYPFNGANEMTEACQKCCQEADHEVPWHCDKAGESLPRCGLLKDVAECSAREDCKAKARKGVLRKCKERKCKKVKDAEKCEKWGCEVVMKDDVFKKCVKKNN